ncbi:aminotransferase class V-fold PLP-dependent enzyme [Knoellia locipacati]|uniref:Aspartate aminotransferase family protein n=1 Tax=Knoellia locipacati TaxID=882824 RepID=A0A512SXV2_9MICO|nr:aminotransferase class V-fold PLP-dependent enzyme [Knoellia locipacati]GEQ12791.1 aspartate aminotransferase family protein [Knoellia locipacati]
MAAESRDADKVLEQLRAYRSHDAPTHGGRVLSYVYDSGRADLDEVAAQAMRLLQPVNGLDPTTFPSVALMESDLVEFGRAMLHGPTATGSVTSGGTESCLLAVKAARDLWVGRGGSGRPRLVLSASTHAAFHKAAHYFGLDVVVVPVDVESGRAPASALVEALGPQVALVVVSAPSYPHGVIDAVAEVAGAAADAGIPCHVDACVGGWVLPWWEAAGGDPLPQWDFRVRGVSSISADIHKYGYVPKGASLLLFADGELDLARYFAITDWLGYPVVNPTMLGTRSATSLAAAWAVVQTLGEDGYAVLARRVVAATSAVVAAVEGIDGLRVQGDRQGPLVAVATDESVEPGRQVDPLLWVAGVAERGFVLQGQPAMAQADGTIVPHTAHLTITPVTEGLLGELVPALVAAADAVRGHALPSPEALSQNGIPDPVALADGARAGGDLDLTTVLMLIETLPREASAQLLSAFLQRFTAPRG